jgi:nitrite reductase/ring-hydroxylating ferredoxin subunit
MNRVPADPRLPDHCNACGLPDRRDFLRQSVLAVTGIALGLGLAPAQAMAWPLSLVTGQRAGPDHLVYPIPLEDGAQIDKENEVILVRTNHTVYCFNLACPHRRVAINWFPDRQQFECPKHHSRYTPDGVFVSGRATRGLDRFALTRQDSNVSVDLTKMFKQDEDLAGWTGARLVV